MTQLQVQDGLPPASCDACGRQVDPRDPSLFREVVGWTKERRRRPGGGKPGGRNQVSYARETGLLMHDGCLQTMKETGNARQEPLL